MKFPYIFGNIGKYIGIALSYILDEILKKFLSDVSWWYWYTYKIKCVIKTLKKISELERLIKFNSQTLPCNLFIFKYLIPTW